MMKKVFGYLFYVLGCILLLGLLFGGFPSFFKSLLTKDGVYITGQFIGLAMISASCYTFFKLARKWTKKNPIMELDSIGKN